MGDLVTMLDADVRAVLARITALERQDAQDVATFTSLGRQMIDHASRIAALERDVASLLRRVDGLTAAAAGRGVADRA